MTRAAILAFGLAGRYFHVPLLQAAGIEICAVASRQRDVVRETLPHAAIVTDDEAFARDDIDLVVIATPNELHVPQARAALQSGKHVVVDKPMSLTTADADELIALARTQRRVLTVFQNRRWDADFLTIRELIAHGRFGELNAFHARWDRYRPEVVDRWREHGPGGGVLYDLGAHLIDQALCLFGMPEWLQADVFAQRAGASVADGFEILLGKGRARTTLGVSTLAADGGPRYRVHGARGSYVKSGLDVQEPQLRAGMLATDATFGVEPREQWGVFTEGSSAGMQGPPRELIPSARGEWTEFYTRVRSSIERGTPPPVAPEEARNVIRVIEAVMESSQTGRRITL